MHALQKTDKIDQMKKDIDLLKLYFNKLRWQNFKPLDINKVINKVYSSLRLTKKAKRYFEYSFHKYQYDCKLIVEDFPIYKRLMEDDTIDDELKNKITLWYFIRLSENSSRMPTKENDLLIISDNSQNDEYDFLNVWRSYLYRDIFNTEIFVCKKMNEYYKTDLVFYEHEMKLKRTREHIKYMEKHNKSYHTLMV